MKIVIDISDEVYNFIINRGHIPYAVNIANVIANGMPLGNDKFCHCGADMLEGDNKGLKKKELGVYANYDKCVPCVYMSFHGCTHPLKDDIGDVNGCVYFADVRKEIEDDI